MYCRLLESPSLKVIQERPGNSSFKSSVMSSLGVCLRCHQKQNDRALRNQQIYLAPQVSMVNVLKFRTLSSFFFQIKCLLVFRAEVYKMDVRIANREDPDQIASS